MPVLLLLVGDSAAVVVKRAVRASGRILRAALKWFSNANVVTTEMEATWKQLNTLKIDIIKMIESLNDG